MLLTLAALLLAPPAPPPLSLLFLGDNAGHQPAARFAQLQPVLAARGVAMAYTERLADLNAANLAKYDGLVIYANHPTISPEQEQALLDYVAAGKGFIPLHCASFCFLNSPKYIALVGAQFKAHTTGVFRTQRLEPAHPIWQGLDGFESWDETYTHHKHNPAGRTVLETRREGDIAEPWTWVRTEGKGRVFYTAWGHDKRTWSHPGFHALVERGIRWACGQDPALATGYVDAPKITPIAAPESDFAFTPAKVPFYPPSKEWGKTSEPLGKMPLPLPPEKSVRHYAVPAGFELKLFAADADFQGGKPIATAWDERGRLWACVTVDYPNELQKPGEGRDKIVILEDTDGDGRADKFTVFADKLSIPTSLTFAHGGVIVHQAPHTLFLKDTDGDGVADLKQVLFTGWATNDTHAGPSNLRYGFDGYYYGSVGYAGFNGSVGGEKFNFRQGYYRFKVEPAEGGKLAASGMEFLRSTNNNTWGLAFAEDGQLFGSTANGCPLVHVAVPNRVTEKLRGQALGVLPSITLDNRYHPVTEKVRQVDFHGGFTSAANCAIYTARTYPREYWNKAAFVSDPTGHLTATFQLQPAGADFVARYGWNLAAADDEWAAPIDAQVGPDGHVWLLDWYNYIVQHNPTPAGFTTGKGNAYQTELRDKKHGRIYRVVYTAAKPEPRPNLAGAKPEALVAALKHPNLGWRLHAQRILAESPKAGTADALFGLLADETLDEAGLAPAATHAVHLLGQRGLLAPDKLTAAHKASVERALTRHPSQALKQNLLAALPPSWGDTPTRLVLGSLTDDSAATAPLRLAAYLSAQAADTFNADANAVFDYVARHPADLGDTTTAAAIRAATARDAAAIVRRAGAKAEPYPAPVFALITNLAGQVATQPGGVGGVLAALKPGPNADAIVAGLAAGVNAKTPLAFTAEQQAAVLALLPKLSPPARGSLLRLATLAKVPGLDTQLAALSEELLKAAADAKRPEPERLAAARQALEFRPADAATADKLLALVTPAASPAFATAVVELLGTSPTPAVGQALVARVKDLPPSARAAALRMVLSRPESIRAFLDAVETGKLRFDALALDQKTALGQYPDAQIAGRARKLLALGGGLPDADREKVVAAFRPNLTQVGQVPNGQRLFGVHCAKCHRHGDAGENIGPDLTGMAVHPKEELLIAILDPSRSVEGNFRAYTAKLADGRVLTGLLAAESKTAVDLLDAENKRHSIARDDLEEFTESAKSLMPEGFEKQMTAAELTDLLEFLTHKGKYVPIPLEKYATVTTAKGMFYSTEDEAERIVLPDYKPRTHAGVPFALTDPQGGKTKNAILLHSQNGTLSPTMPKSVSVPCNTAAKAIHILGGVGGWAFPAAPKGTTSLIVRLHYATGPAEDHELKNGDHIADYVRRVDVPGSQFAFLAKRAQVRYLAVTPKKGDVITKIEFVKGGDAVAPLVLAVTVETP